MRHYRQNVEMELMAILFAIAGLFIVSGGLVWAAVFAVRWLIK